MTGDTARRWLSEVLVADAVQERVHNHWRSQQAQDSIGLQAAFQSCVDQQLRVILTTTTSTKLAGRAVGAGSDFVVLDDNSRGHVFVPFHSIAALESDANRNAADPIPSGVLDSTFVTALAAFADAGARCLVASAGATWRGDICVANSEVVVVDRDDERQGQAVITTALIDHVLVFGTWTA